MPTKNKAILTLIGWLCGLFALIGCASDDKSPGYVAMTINCDTSYRSSVYVPIENQTSIVLDDSNTSQEVRYADFVLHAQYESGRAAYQGRSLTVWVATTEPEKSLHHTLYQMREDQLADNQFIGDHGFTGLVYTHHPTTQAELQYRCSAK